MNLLFQDIDEIRKHIGFLYATADFYGLRPDLVLATEDVVSIVGEDIYIRALAAYQGDHTDDLSKELISLFQYPIAMLAYLSYAQNADISHEDTGRKVKISRDSETMPWEWQVERDNKALRDKGNRGIDRLVDFLDRNISSLPEWRDSPQRKNMAELFVSSAQAFDDVVPIDRSRTFYLRVLPFVRREDRELSGDIGAQRYEEIKAAMRSGEITGEQQRIIGLCREIIPLRVMATAVRRLSVQVLPDSVVTRFDAGQGTLKASNPATAEMISAVESSYLSEAGKAVRRLQQYITLLDPDKGESRPDTDYSREKFFSV